MELPNNSATAPHTKMGQRWHRENRKHVGGRKHKKASELSGKN
jgi:hypothetical protein